MHVVDRLAAAVAAAAAYWSNRTDGCMLGRLLLKVAETRKGAFDRGSFEEQQLIRMQSPGCLSKLASVLISS